MVPLNFRRFLVMDRERERVLSAYERLRVHHPALPPNLRDFQVVFHMKRGNFGGEFFLSRLTWSVLWPIAKQGTTCWEPCQPAMGSPCPCWWPLFSFRLVQNLRTCTCLLYLNLTFTGSTIVVICPLTTIAQQLMSDCNKYGINALAGLPKVVQHLVIGRLEHPEVSYQFEYEYNTSVTIRNLSRP